MGDILQKPDSLPLAATGSGHRARLLERYIKAGMSSLNDYEILELILTFALPRRDTKPLAKRLMADYGTVSAVLNAPLDELCEINGLGKRSAAIFTLIKDTILFYQNENIVKKTILTHRGKVEEYLRFKFGHSREEYAAAIFLDNNQGVIGTEIVAHGTVTRCAVYPRKIMERAIKCGAAAFIFAHNHPAGTTQPSDSDWRVTEQLHKAGHVMDVKLIDHIIISKDCVVSLREYDRWPL